MSQQHSGLGGALRSHGDLVYMGEDKRWCPSSVRAWEEHSGAIKI